MFEGFLANAGNLLAGTGGYIDPNLLTAFNAQNAATGGNGALNNTGTGAAKVANAENALAGKLEDALKTAGLTDEFKQNEADLAKALSAAQWQQAGAAMAPNIFSGLKTGLSKSEMQKELWKPASVRLPTYVLGR
jgi:hypothetical protein